MVEPCVYEGKIAGLSTKVEHLEDSLEKTQSQFLEMLKTVQEEIKKINAQWSERPSWTVTTLITFLVGLVSVMSTYIIMGG